MSFIFFRNSRHLRNCLVIGANVRLLGIYSDKFISSQCIVSPLSTYCEVARRLPETITRFSLKEPKISYQYSDTIHLYQDKKHGGGTIDQTATILVLDLGTTGVNSKKDQITEIAIRDLKGGPDSTFHTLVNPELPLKNHKTNQILTKSNVPRYFCLMLLKWVKSRRMDSKLVLLVAHNGHCFDFPFLVRAFEQNGNQIPNDWLLLDSLPFARQLRHPDGTKLEKGNHKLNDLVTFCNVVPEGSAHKAMADVNALCFVLQHMTFVLKLTITDLIKRSFTPSRYL
ncbi:exonuclease DPD1, chloroplastic/mitochondrial-like [Carex rostrata]